MDRSRFFLNNYFLSSLLFKNNILFIIDDIKYEPIFFYIDFSLPENQHLKPEDFFSLDLILLYIKTIDIYWKRSKQYINIKKIYKNNLIFINLIVF